MKKPLPYEQGHLDGLCGAYALINSVSWCLHTYRLRPGNGHRPIRPLRAHEYESLFARIISVLPAHRPRSPIVDGLHTLDLANLLREAAYWLDEHRRVTLSIRRPYSRKACTSQKVVAQHLAAHLNEPGHAAIVGLEPPWHHWTSVTAVTPAQLHVLDSTGAIRISLKRAGRYRKLLRPSAIFFFSLQSLSGS